jgi:two-component system, NarL family, nitrate/nitrite response regulator NarL
MSTSKKIRIAIVDDHQIVIDGLQSLLEDEKQLRIVATATSGQQMLKTLENTEVDLLLTDIQMPEMNGMELAVKVRTHFPTIKILALSMSGQGELVNEMIDKADIGGYVLKNIGKKELVSAIEKIHGGGVYFSEEVLMEMIRSSERKKENVEVNLTQREIELIRLIEKEKNNREIAEMLFISERTVETHRKNIFRKTKTNSVLGLIKYVYEHKLL